MKNKKQILTYCLLGILVIINMPNVSTGAFFQSLGMSVVAFAAGLLLGFIVTGIFIFFHNILKPNNKIATSIQDRINIGLVIAILYSLTIPRH